jgi:hypothetical protein
MCVCVCVDYLHKRNGTQQIQEHYFLLRSKCFAIELLNTASLMLSVREREDKLTNFIEQSSSWEADSWSASQEFPKCYRIPGARDWIITLLKTRWENSVSKNKVIVLQSN